MHDLSIWGWLIVAGCAFMVGLSKTGIPGLGLLTIVLLTTVLPARQSTGAMLLMLVAGDVIAVAYYRRHAVWKHLIALCPPAVVGVIIGFCLMGKITDRQLQIIIGSLVLVLLALNRFRSRLLGNDTRVPTAWWVAWLVGIAAGITTMMANAAGPIVILYFLAMRLDKHEFIGTGAWYYLMLNLFKVPFSIRGGMITPGYALMDLAVAPAIVVGAAAGILVFKRIPQKAFTAVVEVLVLAAAVKLLVPPAAWGQLWSALRGLGA